MKNDKDERKKRQGMKGRTQGDTLGRRWQGVKNDKVGGKKGQRIGGRTAGDTETKVAERVKKQSKRK